MVFPDKQKLLHTFAICMRLARFHAEINGWTNDNCRKVTGCCLRMRAPRFGEQRKLIWKWIFPQFLLEKWNKNWPEAAAGKRMSCSIWKQKVFWSLWWTFYSGHFLLASIARAPPFSHCLQFAKKYRILANDWNETFWVLSSHCVLRNCEVRSIIITFSAKELEKKKTLDFILCQSRKLSMKKVEMKNASLKAFQMTNLVQQQRRRGSRA